MTSTDGTVNNGADNRWQRLWSLVFIALCTFVSLPATAEHGGNNNDSSPHRQSVLLVGSDNTTFNLRFIDLLKRYLGDEVDIVPYSDAEAAVDPGRLVITLGGSALAQAHQSSSWPPTLALMVTEDQFSRYAERGETPISSVYYDAPLVRQALLGKLILPQASRVALLVQPGYETHYDELIRELQGYDLEARVFTVRDEESLIGTLSRALSYGDFLLAVPDPVIFNPQTIKHILLTAYRKNRVVVGPGRAFVRAGVLASTFPPLEAMARAAALQISHYHDTGELLPPSHPIEFDVEINQQVAHSLNIPVPDKDALIDGLKLQYQPSEQGGRP
ncbi:ABC transporter substrate-binding protein [Marinobacter zhejiangensis]|uniref:ABC transporter substrate binding protein n=1 Tax=Marinobacter zhejiangensis TaxID=488535 RepID=A0A1I4PEM9_9GAMM|nr:hypothetical protein [Marinobacter zhejiangensis]SFM26025.1 hypothetical protein SAMN04487963_1964 [Marinobacter zhejiangensis]